MSSALSHTHAFIFSNPKQSGSSNAHLLVAPVAVSPQKSHLHISQFSQIQSTAEQWSRAETKRYHWSLHAGGQQPLNILVRSQKSCVLMEQLLKGTLLSCFSDQITRKHSQKALMCNMGKSRVHHSVKFRLDLNRTLPLLTLVSTSPDKPICCGPCQLTKQPPPAHRKKKNTVTLSLPAQDQAFYLVPILLLVTHATQGHDTSSHVPFHLLREASSVVFF